MLTEIPTRWRMAVIAVLRRGKPGKDVLLRRQARLDWSALTLNPYDTSLLSALVAVLARAGLKGRPNLTMEEPGETYEFVFNYDADAGTVPVYTKINLLPGGAVVIIYSAHRPRKEDELTR